MDWLNIVRSSYTHVAHIDRLKCQPSPIPQSITYIKLTLLAWNALQAKWTKDLVRVVFASFSKWVSGNNNRSLLSVQGANIIVAFMIYEPKPHVCRTSPSSAKTEACNETHWKTTQLNLTTIAIGSQGLLIYSCRPQVKADAYKSFRKLLRSFYVGTIISL